MIRGPKSALFLLLPLLACQAPVAEADLLAPREAIEQAAAHPETGYAGTFKVDVVRVQRTERVVYVNTEEDYRDQRCLTVVVPVRAMDKLLKRIGLESERQLLGRTLRVKGVAQRMRIAFTVGGRVTDKYYYQTHVRVDSPSQLELAK
jgi:hypothetical protein